MIPPRHGLVRKPKQWQDVGQLKKKTMRLKHEGARITLQGVQPNLEACTAISAATLQCLVPSGEVCQVLELHIVVEQQ